MEEEQNITRKQLEILFICMHAYFYIYICKHFTLARGFIMGEKKSYLTGVERSRYFKLIFPQFVSDKLMLSR